MQNELRRELVSNKLLSTILIFTCSGEILHQYSGNGGAVMMDD